MLKMAICDDEPYHLNRTEDLIKGILDGRGIDIYVIDTYLLGKDLLRFDKYMEYDAIFLDIDMSGMNGPEIAKQIRENRQDIILVFIAASSDYAVEGYKMEAIRFLLKDVLEETMPECIEVIIRRLCLHTHKVCYHFTEGQKEMPVDSIGFIESQKHKLLFNVMEKQWVSYSLYDKLDNIEKGLSAYGFLRIHKSYLVNMRFIKAIVHYRAYLKSGEILPIPRDKYRKVKQKYYEMTGKTL